MTLYILDANAFIEAAKRYYAHDIVPGYWSALRQHHKTGRIISVDRVKDELDRGKDWVADWSTDNFSAAFVDTKSDSGVASHYGNLMRWAQAQSSKYTPAAITEFAEIDNADPWLIAYALNKKGSTIVTDEQYDANIKKRIKIPNVCKEYQVNYHNVFEMLRSLGASFK